MSLLSTQLSRFFLHLSFVLLIFSYFPYLCCIFEKVFGVFVLLPVCGACQEPQDQEPIYEQRARVDQAAEGTLFFESISDFSRPDRQSVVPTGHLESF